MNNGYLVGGLEPDFYFPCHIWDSPNPIDCHMFQDGYCTTNQVCIRPYTAQLCLCLPIVGRPVDLSVSGPLGVLFQLRIYSHSYRVS